MSRWQYQISAGTHAIWEGGVQIGRVVVPETGLNETWYWAEANDRFRHEAFELRGQTDPSTPTTHRFDYGVGALKAWTGATPTCNLVNGPRAWAILDGSDTLLGVLAMTPGSHQLTWYGDSSKMGGNAEDGYYFVLELGTSLRFTHTVVAYTHLDCRLVQPKV